MTSLAILRGTRLTAFSILLTGCAFITDPNEKLRVSLALQQTDDLGIVAPRADVRATDVVVRGTFSTPCLGYSVTADAKQNKGTVEVTLRGRQAGEVCLTAIGRFPYTATVAGVSPGSHRVVVQHVIADANWPVETVVDTTLRIP